MLIRMFEYGTIDDYWLMWIESSVIVVNNHERKPR